MFQCSWYESPLLEVVFALGVDSHHGEGFASAGLSIRKNSAIVS